RDGSAQSTRRCRAPPRFPRLSRRQRRERGRGSVQFMATDVIPGSSASCASTDRSSRQSLRRRLHPDRTMCQDLLSLVSLSAMRRFILTMEGPNLEDTYEVELVRLPEEGEPIETRLGTCIVIRAEPSPESSKYAGKIVCRLP